MKYGLVFSALAVFLSTSSFAAISEGCAKMSGDYTLAGGQFKITFQPGKKGFTYQNLDLETHGELDAEANRWTAYKDDLILGDISLYTSKERYKDWLNKQTPSAANYGEVPANSWTDAFSRMGGLERHAPGMRPDEDPTPYFHGTVMKTWLSVAPFRKAIQDQKGSPGSPASIAASCAEERIQEVIETAKVAERTDRAMIVTINAFKANGTLQGGEGEVNERVKELLSSSAFQAQLAAALAAQQ